MFRSLGLLCRAEHLHVAFVLFVAMQVGFMAFAFQGEQLNKYYQVSIVFGH
jgi:hypothetical protein